MSKMFDELFAMVKEYAHQRRLDESYRKSKGDPMDVSQLHQSPWQGESEWRGDDEWSSDQSYDAMYEAICQHQRFN